MGSAYGTILCDPERHRVVDLPPERPVELFQAWGGIDPGAGIISRDWGDHYIKGATAGVPNAFEVADWRHPLSNLRKALVYTPSRPSPATPRSGTLPSSIAGGYRRTALGL